MGVLYDPPPLTPIVRRAHKGSCQTLVVSALDKLTEPPQRNLVEKGPPATNQQTKTTFLISHSIMWRGGEESTCSASRLLFVFGSTFETLEYFLGILYVSSTTKFQLLIVTDKYEQYLSVCALLKELKIILLR